MLTPAKDQAIDKENDDRPRQRDQNALEIDAGHHVLPEEKSGQPSTHKSTNYAQNQVDQQAAPGFHDYGSQETCNKAYNERCDYSHVNFSFSMICAYNI
jgi:hypothetical protein